jgi:bicarbonate transport system ATP-binding protein
MKVDIPRPRKRMDVINHPNYYSPSIVVIIYFLNQQNKSKKIRSRKQTRYLYKA